MQDSTVEKKTIMVLEDEGLLLQAIAKKLEGQGVSVVSCEAGTQAIDYLQTLPSLPDLIWLDFHLKDMNGVQFMGELKKNEKWKNIPVIVVSNTATDEHIHNVMALGVKKYIVKADQRLDDIIALVVSLVSKNDNAQIN